MSDVPFSVFKDACGVFKNKVQVTASGSWTVPAGVYFIEVWATGGGGSGGGCAGGGVPPGGGGGGASATLSSLVAVNPGDVLSINIGAGGVGLIGNGNDGGASSVRLGLLPIVSVSGGLKGNSPTGASVVAGGAASSVIGASISRVEVAGGAGGTSGSTSANGFPGGVPSLRSRVGTAANATVAGTPVSSGGVVGSVRGGGGGGGTSIYGAGGDGASGSNSSGAAVTGANAAATSYGAGGGGSSGSTSGNGTGGNGANGIVEIYY